MNKRKWRYISITELIGKQTASMFHQDVLYSPYLKY